MAWNVNVCSSPSILNLSNKSRGEQVVGMVSPRVSPSTRDGEGPPSGGASPKRQFYSAFDQQDEIVEEDLSEDCLAQTEKKRRLTADQVRLLETSFEVENKLDPDRKVQIAKQLGLQPRQVAVWFQNRRARSKTKQLERDYNALKADFDAIVKQNENLRAEVVRLTALQAQGRERCEAANTSEGGGGEGSDGEEEELAAKESELAELMDESCCAKPELKLGSSNDLSEVVDSALSAIPATAAGVLEVEMDKFATPAASGLVKLELMDNSAATSPASSLVKLELLESSAALNLHLDLLSATTDHHLFTSVCNPLLLQQLALTLEAGACFTEDRYSLFVAPYWDDSCNLDDPWND